MATLAESANSGTPAVLAALTNGALAAATRSLAIEYASTASGSTPSRLASSRPRCTRRIATTSVTGFARSGGPARSSNIVEGVLFLESLSHITGEILRIDGGQIAGH